MTRFKWDRAPLLTDLVADPRAWYRADGPVPSSPPDVDARANLAASPAGDLEQLTPANQPHLVAVNQAPALECNSQWLQTPGAATANLLSPGENDISLWVVGRVVDFANAQGMADFGTGVNNTGAELSMLLPFAGVTARFINNAGVRSAPDPSPDSEEHVYRATMTPGGVWLAKDGVEVADDGPALNTGLTNFCKQARVGARQAGNPMLGGHVRAVFLAANVTPEDIRQIDEVLAYTRGVLDGR